jgi:hypothetical protein
MTKATDTRALTDQLRAIHTAYRGTFARAGLVAGVSLTRMGRRRVYMLHYGNDTRTGHRFYLDATRRELWIRPVTRATDTTDPLDAMSVDIAACTLFVDALMQSAVAAGYTLSRYSETPETLAQWRAQR